MRHGASGGIFLTAYTRSSDTVPKCVLLTTLWGFWVVHRPRSGCRGFLAEHRTRRYCSLVPVKLHNENPNGINEPYGRAAAVAVCGHGDDLVTDIENLGRPGCLEMWWYDNKPLVLELFLNLQS